VVLIRWVWLRDVRRQAQGNIDDMLASDNAARHQMPPHGYPHFEDRYPQSGGSTRSCRCKALQLLALLQLAGQFGRRIAGILDARSACSSIGEKEHVTIVHLVTCKV
jgi:hypothetical protein